jgi:hypothetical protein
MAITLVAHVHIASPDGNDVTSGPVDGTGADFIVTSLSNYSGTGAATITDSENGATYAYKTAKTSTFTRARIGYKYNASVSNAMTFTIGNGGIGSAAAEVLLFSGVLTASDPSDGENGATPTSATSWQPGSITPSQNGDLIVTGLCHVTTDTYSINSSFIIPSGGQNTYIGGQRHGNATAYLIQGTAAAVNPTWSWTTSDDPAIAIAAFKAAAGGGGGGGRTTKNTRSRPLGLAAGIGRGVNLPLNAPMAYSKKSRIYVPERFAA